MVMILREVAANGTVTNHEIGTVTQFSVTPGSTYSIIDSETGNPVEDVVLRQDGDNLLIELDGETIATIDGYYVDGANATFYNDVAMVPEAAESGSAWEVSEAQAANVGLVAGVFGGVLAAMAGSDSDSTAAPSGGSSSSPTTVTVNAVAGPFIATVGVNVYSTDGTLLTTLNHDFSTGPVDIELDDYSGPILVEVFDINGDTADYRDEGTDSNRSLTTGGVGSTLRAMASTDADGAASVSVTPLTELAAMLAGVNSDNSVSEEQLGSNAQVATLFGLEDILADVSTIFDEGFSTADGTSASEAYGILLSIISGLDQVLSTSSITETLTALVNAISEDEDGNLVLDEEAATNIGAAANLIQQTQAGSGISDDDIEDVVPEEAGDVKPAAILSVIVTAAGMVEVTFSEDISGSEPAAEDFTVEINGETISFTEATVDGSVLSLTPAEGIQSSDYDSVANLTYTPSAGSITDAAGNESITQTVATITNNSIGVEQIIDKAYSALTTSELEGISQTGAAGDDSLSVNIYSGDEDTGIYALDIEQSGDEGDDLLSVDLSGQFIGDSDIPGFNYHIAAYSSTSYTTTTTTTNYLGTTTFFPTKSGSIPVFNTTSTTFETNTNVYFDTTTTSESGFVTTGGPQGNSIALAGAAGSDTLSVNFNATADEVSQIPGNIYYYASATVTGTELPPVPAEATGSESSESHSALAASISGNSISLDGGTGDDLLAVNLAASASALSSDTYTETKSESVEIRAANATAVVTGNMIDAAGGEGNDNIAIDLLAYAYQEAASSLAATLEAPPWEQAMAMAVLESNDIYAYGDAGTSDAVDVDLSALAMGDTKAEAGINGNSISATGNIVDIALNASAEAEGIARASINGEGERRLEGPRISGPSPSSEEASDYDIIASGNNVNVALMANASASTDVYAQIAGNAIYADGSNIELTLSAAALAQATTTAESESSRAYILATADVGNSSNSIYGFGDAEPTGADDSIYVRLNAAAQVEAGGNVTVNYSDAYAIIGANGSSSEEGDARAYNQSNSLHLYGSAGSDLLAAHLTANMTAMATGFASASASEGEADAVLNAYVSAYNSYNDVSLFGGAGESSSSSDAADTLTVELFASAAASAMGTANAYASESADARIQAEANAFNYEAGILAVGSAGEDSINVSLRASAFANAQGTARADGYTAEATISASAQASAAYSSSIEIFGGNYSSGSNDGDDSITLEINGVAEAMAAGSAIASGTESSADADIFAAADFINYNNDIVIFGSAGADSIDINVNQVASAVATGFASANGYSETISAGIQAYGYGYVASYSEYEIYGGDASGSDNDGNDLISLDLIGQVHAQATGQAIAHGGYYAEADIYASASNYIYEVDASIYGSQGSDDIQVSLEGAATASASGEAEAGAGSSADARVHADASMYIQSNDIDIYGGANSSSNDAADIISVVMDAQAQANADGTAEAATTSSGWTVGYVSANAYASIYDNNIRLYGSAGADNLSIDLRAAATATASSVDSSSQATAGATINNNSIYLEGGTGDDIISVNMSAVANANAELTEATASISENSININGGEGDDSIGVSFTADYVRGNDIFIAGGAGADVIEIQAEAALSASGNDFTFFYGSTGEFGDTIVGLDAFIGSANDINFYFDSDFSLAPSIVFDGVYTEAAGAYFYYDDFATSSYALYFDADGNGSGAASTVAAFTTNIGAATIDIYYTGLA